MAIEKFKKFFSEFQANYCNHFEGLDESFTLKIKYLIELRQDIEGRAESVNKRCKDLQTISNDLGKKHTLMGNNNIEIEAKIASIKAKLHKVMSPVQLGDDFVL